MGKRIAELMALYQKQSDDMEQKAYFIDESPADSCLKACCCGSEAGPILGECCCSCCTCGY